MKLVKITAILLAAVVIILMLAPFIIPKHLYLEWAIGAIESRYPVRVTVQDAQIGLLPNFRLAFYGIDIQVKDDDEEHALLRADTLLTRCNWHQLLQEQPALSLSLEKADIHIIELQPERYNFSPLLTPAKATQAQKARSLPWIRSAFADNAGASAETETQRPLLFKSLHLRDVTIHHQPHGEAKSAYPIEELKADYQGKDEAGHKLDTTLKAELAGLTIDGTFAAKLKEAQADDPWNRLNLTSSKVSLMKPGQLRVQDQALVLKNAFKKTGTGVDIEDGHLELGKQAMTFSGTQRSGDLTLNFKADPLNLQYLKGILPALGDMPPTEGAGIEGKMTKKARDDQASISGSLRAKSVQLPEYTLNNVSAQFWYRDPNLKISDLKGETLDGSFAGNASLKLGDKAAYSFDIDVRNIAVEQLGSVDTMATGRGDLQLKAEGQGFEEADWSRNLSGNGNLQVREMQLPKINLLSSLFSLPAWDVMSARAGLIDAERLKQLRSTRTPPKDLASAFQLVDGAVQISDLKLQFPQALATVAGSIGLDKKLDLTGRIKLNEKIVGSLIRNSLLKDTLSDPDGSMVIPLRVTGSTSSPLVTPDNAYLAQRFQAYLQRSLTQKSEGLLEELIKKPSKKEEEAVPEGEAPAEAEKKPPSPLQEVQDLFRKKK